MELPPTQARSAEDEGGGQTLLTISHGIVRILQEHYGRGPMEARTYFQDDLVVCILHGGFTRVEEVLIDEGRLQEIEVQRAALQDLMRPQLGEVVEAATGRIVTAFMRSNIHQTRLTCLIFVLDGPSTGWAARPSPRL